MITPYQKPEGRDEKAGNFWSNLAGKLGLSAPLIRSASAPVEKAPLLSDGIQVHADMAGKMKPQDLITTPEYWDCECDKDYIHPAAQDTCNVCGSHRDESPDARVNEVEQLLGVKPTKTENHGPSGPAREASIATVSGQHREAGNLLDRYTRVMHRAVAELGQSERVKAADRLSRIEADMAAFKDKLSGFGADKSMADLSGEISAKADAVSGACVQLRDKVEGLSMPQAAAIENAFLVLSDAKTYLDKIKSPAADMGGGAMEMTMGLEPGMEDISGDIPAMPPALEEDESEKDRSESGLTAGHISAFVKKAMDAAYDDLRMIHTKLCLVESMLSSLVSELGVTEMLGPSMETPGMPPAGMPPTDQVEGEQKPLEGDADLMELGARCKGKMSAFAAKGTSPMQEMVEDRMSNPRSKKKDLPPWMKKKDEDKDSDESEEREASVKIAASGDPGDTEPGNLIYKDLGKCRDCVWFESDWTHETYRDKCKHCTHASLGGATENFWPRSQQMVVWSPQWAAPQAKDKKAFQGTLGISQTAKVHPAALEIAREIVANAAHTAVDLGTEFMSYFVDPVIARAMPVIAADIAAEIENLTGIEIAITASKANEWGHKKLAAKPIRIPKDFEVQPLKPGENPPGKTTCGTCNLSWDDDKPTSWTPAPSARCPFEYYHVYDEEGPDSELDDENPDRQKASDYALNGPRTPAKNPLGIGGTASKAGEVIVACDAALVHLAKGEKRKIKELREQLQGEKDAAKIKALNDAIDSLYSRIDSDKERREKRRTDREERRKKDQEAADSAHAKLPEPATASFKGTLCLGKKSDHEDGGKHDPAAQDATNPTPLPTGKGKKKLFKVVAVSSSANSFGLKGVVLMAQDGEAWEAAHGDLELPAKGQTISMPLDENGEIAWAMAGYEIPRKLPAPPSNVISEVWGKTASSSGRSL